MTFYAGTTPFLNSAPDGLRLDQPIAHAPPQRLDEHSPESSLSRTEHSMEEVNGVRGMPLTSGVGVGVGVNVNVNPNVNSNPNSAATNGSTNGTLSSNGGNTSASSNKKRRRSNDHPTHTRALAACEACRVSKTRCDSARPVCAKCSKRGLACVYPDKDPSSIFETWGNRILAAIETHGRMLSDLAESTRQTIQQQQQQQHSPLSALLPMVEDDDLETLSRRDVTWTPITGSDMILSWAVFPREKPASTFPASAYSQKPNPYAFEAVNPSPRRMMELRDIYMTKIQTKNPIVDAELLDTHIASVLDNGFGWSASSCMILIVFALAAVWGNFPDDERRPLTPDEIGESRERHDRRQVTMAVPEHRMKESLIYMAMAHKRMSAAYLDDSLLSVMCFCLFGIWHQYNFEPIQGWQMFRTASMAWETYNLKNAHGKSQRSKQEESLEQRLYWTCLKSECEIRHELTDLPTCTLQESAFPFSLPTFPITKSMEQSAADLYYQEDAHPELAPSSYYYYLAEISLRRLLNRTRSAATLLSPEIDPLSSARLHENLSKSEHQLQQWLDCLPQTLRFNVPPDSLPPPGEPELVKLVRERYVEVRELLCRAYLYLCLHGGERLTPAQIEQFGNYASLGLRLCVYRIQTEYPYFRHPGSWGACRVRFNMALCLIAAVRGKAMGIESARNIIVPPNWRECVGLVQERLDLWSDQGGGIGGLATTLEWLVS